MDSLTITAASGMRARMESLDMLANNIANAETGGYKIDREFYSLYSGADATAAGPAESTVPVIEKNYIDFSPGNMRSTSNPLDFALQGAGFFQVKSPAGTAYTRNGSFQISTAGNLTTADGSAVLDSTGNPIKLDPKLPIEAMPDGSLNQSGRKVAQLGIVDFPATDSLVKQGNTLFRLSDPKIKPTASSATLKQGALEASNVGSAESAVRLVSVLRQFEMLQKAVHIGVDMDKKSVEEVARVGS